MSILDTMLENNRKLNGLVRRVKELELEINGSDGRPKFNSDEIIPFMAENQLDDLEEAYQLKHSAELVGWENPSEKITTDNLNEKVDAFLNGEQEKRKTSTATYDDLEDQVSDALNGLGE